MRRTELRGFLAPARRVFEDHAFWQASGVGLACFLAAGVERWYHLPLAPADRGVVGSHFHIKPLLPVLEETGAFYVLTLSEKRARLLRGTAEGLEEVDTPEVPAGMAAALRTHDRDEPLEFHARPSPVGGGWVAIFSGQGVGIDDHKDDLRTYFRQVDKGLHPLLRQQTAPLVLASVECLWPLYREVNTYPHLLLEGVHGCPDHVSDRDLHAKAWELVRPSCTAARHRSAALYERLAGTGRTTADLVEAVRAAAAGHIEVLFVPADCEQWGRLDALGHVAVHDEAAPGDEDLFNLAAVHTLHHRGTVFAVPSDQVPGHGPLAAIFWLPHARKVE
jgi:hypothetical protein